MALLASLFVYKVVLENPLPKNIQTKLAYTRGVHHLVLLLPYGIETRLMLACTGRVA
ncbi:hypothetical protein Mhypo_02940 [Meiothermus hypogaeus]|uniref:Uncharacterized protein n=1 Tax=Meiothermus hypogaeus TaxID=884155 RepID=A0ABX9MMJ2_9DEIN|nr:hypothetical protein Mhypo_02940 [Meiothermus hypogaeus]